MSIDRDAPTRWLGDYVAAWKSYPVVESRRLSTTAPPG